MKRLNKEEEQTIISQLLNGNFQFLGCGSTRMTYAYDEDRVIKITPDINTLGQHKTEVKAFGDNGREFLAEIFAYGERIAIVERVIPFEEDDFDTYMSFLDGEDWAKGHYPVLSRVKDFEEQLSLVTETLEGNCISLDGQQFGVAKDNRLVAYDYGYAKEGCTLGNVYGEVSGRITTEVHRDVLEKLLKIELC